MIINNNKDKMDRSSRIREILDTLSDMHQVMSDLHSELSSLLFEEKQEDNEIDYYIYTDGSCINNGYENAAAGYGVYYSKNDVRNVSLTFDGLQTNNIAELLAIKHAFEQSREDLDNGFKIGIVSDSTYAINSLTTYAEKREQNNWKGKIANRELIQEMYENMKEYIHSKKIQFIKIKAHTTETDVHSIGNQHADILAYEASERKLKEISS